MRQSQNCSPAFRTVVPVASNKRRISHGSSILSIGSCFAENIGSRLTDYRLEPLRNPTGVVYNPLSIAGNLRRFLKAALYTPDDIFEYNDCWRCFDFHTSFTAQTMSELLRDINGIVSYTHHFLNSLDSLIITLGTAYGYFLAGTDKIVSNCHRLPAERFERRLISVESATDQLSEILEYLYFLRPSLNVVMTVSPVRHLRDDPHQNSISKAHLICTAAKIKERFGDRVYYFPAYEIMMDELRDYRFYDDDMAHPSALAVEYIWQQFCRACLSEQAQKFITDYEPIRNARTHRIQDSASPQTHKFAQKMLHRIDSLQNNYPDVKLSNDRDYFDSLL